jgi:hypothetical protein
VLLLALHLSSARADEPRATVLVSSLQAQNPEGAGLAGVIEGILARELDGQAGVSVLQVEDAPAFDEYSARTYMDSCPTGEYVGCTLVVGARANARYAITGSVLGLANGAQVQITILDITGSRVMLSFKSDLAPGKDEDFATGVAGVLLAAVQGEIGQQDDIRDEEAPKDVPVVENDVVAAELAELSDELGTLTEVLDNPRDIVKPPPLTLAEIEEQQTEEGGVAPWVRLGITPQAYVRYKNSGLRFPEWQKRALGRASQLHLRVMGGYWRGPTEATFYNRYAYNSTLVVEDSYTAQAVNMGNTVSGGAEVAFGLLPFLDLGVAGGVALGHLTVDVSSIEAPTDPVVLEQTSLWFGPRVAVMFFPTSSVRPGVGGGVNFVNVSAPEATVVVPETAYAFPSAWLVYGQVYGGAELRVDPHVDLFARVPVDFLVGGDPLREHRDTTNAALTPVAPEAGASVAVGGLVGVQVRLGGRKVKEPREFEP